jgi:hypothetical protein
MRFLIATARMLCARDGRIGWLRLAGTRAEIVAWGATCSHSGNLETLVHPDARN